MDGAARRLTHRRGRRPLARWRKSFIWKHVAFSPTRRQLQYLEAYRNLLAHHQKPTLARLAAALGVRRQTVWQMEQTPLFQEWLVTEIRVWRLRRAHPDLETEGEVVELLLAYENRR